MPALPERETVCAACKAPGRCCAQPTRCPHYINYLCSDQATKNETAAAFSDSPEAPYVAPEDKAKEQINTPPHYMHMDVEPVTFAILNRLPFAEGSILKYVCRWRHKNGVQDLLKARRMIDLMIQAENHPDRAEMVRIAKDMAALTEG